LLCSGTRLRHFDSRAGLDAPGFGWRRIICRIGFWLLVGLT
jgi:hypothetical protein